MGNPGLKLHSTLQGKVGRIKVVALPNFTIKKTQGEAF